MTNLSPATQAVVNAFLVEWPYEALEQDRRCLAAALRAAVDQVISSVSPPCGDFNEHDQGFLAAHIKYRDEFLAIADELEGQ